MSAREGMGRDGTSVMNVDEALAYADDNSPLPFKTVNTWKCVLTLADEVHSLREQNRRLRTPAVFDMDAAVEAVCAVWNLHAPDARRIITTATPHLPVYTEFGADGKPFCRRSWNDGRNEGIAKANEFRDLIDPDMEALRRELESLRASALADARDAERYRFIRDVDPNDVDAIDRWDLVYDFIGEGGPELDAAIDAALAQRDTSEGGGM